MICLFSLGNLYLLISLQAQNMIIYLSMQLHEVGTSH